MKNKKILAPLSIAALLLLLLAIILKSGWLVDDAYISFRYIKNLFSGYGLRWNTFERVQAYTNPLYVFAMMPFYAITRDMFISSIVLSTALSMSAVMLGILPKKGKSIIPFVICTLMLMTSKSFVDYSTSGLENPMTFFIIALFYREYFAMPAPQDGKSFLKLCFIASLITINRIDAILLFIPPLCYAFFRDFRPKKIGYGFLGFAPFVLWEIFSLLYYGFLFPNTAYAKLNITTGLWTLIQNGFKYIISSNIYGDNITLLAILAVIILGIFLVKTKKIKYLLSISSVIIYILYIMYIGGDFMVGRFTSAPFFLSVIILFNYMSSIDMTDIGVSRIARRAAAVLATVIIFLGCVPQTSPITSPIRYQQYYDYLRASNPMDRPRDVRSYYYEEAGLSHYIMDIARHGYRPDRVIHKWGIKGSEYDETQVYITGGIGFTGYFCPDETIIIDEFALSDPLLARIPAPPNQWAAHNSRGIPQGYAQTLATSQNVIVDPSLHQYYDHLSIVVSGDIFDSERLSTIVKMNMGKYDYLIDEYTQSEEYKQSLSELGR